MYSSEDFERLFIRYKGEAYPKGESIQAFCQRNKVPYNLFEKWYKDTSQQSGQVLLPAQFLHDLRCKYARVLSVIRQQMNREPQAGEVYIMMSKDRRTVRLYSYDRRSCRLYEQRFDRDYTFMKGLMRVTIICPQTGALGEHAPACG